MFKKVFNLLFKKAAEVENNTIDLTIQESNVYVQAEDKRKPGTQNILMLNMSTLR